MKFINYLESISGVEIYPLISLIIFFLFFIAVGIYLLKSGKDHFNEVSNIPLENNEN